MARSPPLRTRVLLLGALVLAADLGAWLWAAGALHGIGGVESLALVGDKLSLHGGVRDVAGALASHFNLLGFVIIGVLALSRLVSALVWRLRRYDDLAPSTVSA